jgi:hypothetical protein
MDPVELDEVNRNLFHALEQTGVWRRKMIQGQ